MAEPTIAGIPTKDFDKWQAERVASGRAHVNDGGTMAGAEFATPADVAAKADASALTAHTSATTGVHGIADTADLLTTSDIGGSVQGHDADLDLLAALGVVSNPSTGRLAIGGIEVGATPWVNASLINGWTATMCRYRRVGYNTQIQVQGLDGTSSTSSSFMSLPAGFRISSGQAISGQIANATNLSPAWKTVRVNNSSVVNADQSTTAGLGMFPPLPTDDAWPSSI